MGEEAVLEAEKLWKRLGPTWALRNVSFSVGRGFTLIVGPNGSGKSTLLSIAAGFLRPTRGYLKILGASPLAGEGRLRRVAGHAMDPPGLPPLMKVSELVGLSAKAGLTSPGAFSKYASYLGLLEHFNKRIRELSAGFRKRLSIALAASKPDLRALFIDEPFANLDPDGVRRVASIMASLIERGVSVVAATHIVPPTLPDPNYIIVLSEGRLVASGPMAEIASAIRTLSVEISGSTPDLVGRLVSGYCERGASVVAEKDRVVIRGLTLEEAREVARVYGGLIRVNVEEVVKAVIFGEVGGKTG